MGITKIFLTESAWAYPSIYTRVGTLPGISDRNEKLWTMLGALLMELIKSGEKEVVIYNDTRLVDEWNEQVSFINKLAIDIARRLKDKDGLAGQFVSLSLEKLDSLTISSEIQKLQLI